MHAYAPLSSAAMLYAASLGFDWLYAILTPSERASIATAILTMGAAPWACCYDANSPPPSFPPCLYLDWCGFVQSPTNWNPVLSAMTALGAIGIAGEPGMPSLAWFDTIVSGAVAALPLGLVELQGDGLYAESVEYGACNSPLGCWCVRESGRRARFLNDEMWGRRDACKK